MQTRRRRRQCTTMDDNLRPLKKPRVEAPWESYACAILRPAFTPASLRELAYRTLLSEHYAKHRKRIRALPEREQGQEMCDVLKAFREHTERKTNLRKETLCLDIKLFDGDLEPCSLYPTSPLRFRPKNYKCPGLCPLPDVVLQSAGGPPVCRECANFCLAQDTHEFREKVMLRLHMCDPGLNPVDPNHLWIPVHVLHWGLFPQICFSGANRKSTRVSDISLRSFHVGLDRVMQGTNWRPGSEVVGPVVQIMRIADNSCAYFGPRFACAAKKEGDDFVIRVYSIPPACNNRIQDELEEDPLVSDVLAPGLKLRMISTSIRGTEFMTRCDFAEWNCVRELKCRLPSYTGPMPLTGLFGSKRIGKQIVWKYE